MKKVLSCLLAVLLLVSIGAMAFADDVVPSVEAEKQVPTVSEALDADGNDVSAVIVITDYEDKETLPEEAQKQLDDAFEALQDLPALIEDNEDLKTLLDGAEVDAESLFDISIIDDSVVPPLDLKLELVNPDNFAVLLHFVDGEVSIIEAEVDEDDLLPFTLEEVGTYAILSFVEGE